MDLTIYPLSSQKSNHGKATTHVGLNERLQNGGEGDESDIRFPHLANSRHIYVGETT